ncbi:MAG: PucR family transcriptional regulator [Blautia coccoides]
MQKTDKYGPVLMPDDFIWDYDSLGPLTWLQIPEKELEDLLGTYRLLLKDEKNAELLRTLKVYLENNMNYSLTAEKLYVHINTIRNRIDKVNQLLGIDWDSPLNRMKCEILLQYLKL